MPWNRWPPNRDERAFFFKQAFEPGKYEDKEKTKRICDHGREVCMVCAVDYRMENAVIQGMDMDKAMMTKQEQQTREDATMNLLSGSRYIQAGCEAAQSLFEDALKHIKQKQANNKKVQCEPVEYKPPVYSMPEKEKSSKKISERYITRCVQCKSKISSERSAFKCKCLELWYCTKECQQKKPHKDCRKKSVKKGGYMEKIKNNMTKETYAIFTANIAFYNEYGITREMLKDDAEGGDVTAAWMVGIGNKFGIASNDNCPIARNPKAKDKGKVAGESKAIKWFKKAAEGGHPQAMSDLGQMLLDSDDSRTALDWIDLAREAGCTDHYQKLVQNCLMSKEGIKELTEQLKNGDFPNGIRGVSKSPTLSNMVLSYRREFLRNNDWKCSNGAPVINAPILKELDKVIEERSLDYQFVPGRGGSTNEVTLQLLKKVGRHPENVVYRFGNIKKDDGPIIDLYQAKHTETIQQTLKKRTKVLHTCSHSNETPIDCISCMIMGEYRVFAVAHDLYAISTTCALVGWGYQVTYANSLNSTITKETFKPYSRPEINSVLSCLMNNPADVNVYNIAQDPNLYWPIVWYYGSVHAALEKVGGEQLLREVYSSDNVLSARKNRKDIDSSLTAAFPDMPGNLRFICGNGDCPKFDHLESFLKCANCKNRRYCSEICQRADWKIHKKECIKKERNKVESEKEQPVEKSQEFQSFNYRNAFGNVSQNAIQGHESQEQKTKSGTRTREDETVELDNKEKRPQWKGQQKKKQNKKKF